MTGRGPDPVGDRCPAGHDALGRVRRVFRMKLKGVELPAHGTARLPVQAPAYRFRGRPDRSGRAAGSYQVFKSFVTTSFPVGDEIRAVVVDWLNYLRREKLWGLDAPLFPATRVAVGAGLRFEAAGLDRKHWSTASPIRTIFNEAFASVGLPYFNPHS
jgi:hypothetical protein